MDTWATGRHETTVDAVLHSIDPWLIQADGVTISGGEPFDQPDALRELLVGLRARSSTDVLVYSGHALERLALDPFDGLIDALISDPFRIEQPQTLTLRGSDNQRLTCLTPLGHARLGQFRHKLSSGERTLDIMFDDPDGQVFLAGIPARGDLRRLAALLEGQGHTISTTEDVRGHE